MLNSLDLLVILFLVAAVVTVLAICLLFLVKKPLVRRICLFFLAAVALYFAAMGAYIGRFVFVGQTVIALVLGAAAITAVVLELKGKSEKTALISRLAVSASVVLAVLNAAC